MWIARDLNNNLWLHEEKPHINQYATQDDVFWTSGGEYYEVGQDFLPEVTFENSPQEVELVIKK
jgi:hypothetical protein